MNNDQINKFEMLKATNTYLDANTPVYSTIPILAKYKTNLTTVIDGIKKAALDQEAAQVFVGQSKTELKRTIAEKMDVLDDTAEAFAADTDNAELLSRMSNSMSDYYKIPNEAFETKVQNTIELLEVNLPAMCDYGMTQDLIDEVKVYFNEFEEKTGKPRAYQIASRVATESLSDLFKEATKVTEKMDRVMKRYKRSNSSFYNGYQAARKIVQG